MATPDVRASATLAGIRERAKAAADFPLAEIAAFTGPDTKSVGGWIAASALDVPVLLAALDAAQAALARHQQWFTDSSGVKTCGGCLEPVPCKDTDVIRRALSGKEASDGK